jgi:hypothetical protein
MKPILILLIILGGLIAFQPIVSTMEIANLHSNFVAFQAKAASHPEGRIILALGGENDSDHFEDLVSKLSNLKSNRFMLFLGASVSALSLLGLILEEKRNNRKSPKK